MIREWDRIPLAVRRDMSVMMAISTAFYASSWILGFGWEATIYRLVPTRINVTWLAFAFGYLPHGPQRHVKQSHNPFAATNVRSGGERLMRMLFLYQNDHAIHHLFPGVPFYRYDAIWRARREEFSAKDRREYWLARSSRCRRFPFLECSVEQAEERDEIARLAEKVGRSHLLRDLRKIGFGRHEDDRDLLLSSIVQEHLMSHSRSTEDGHVDIEDHGVRKWERPERSQPFLSIACGAHLVSLPAQVISEQFQEIAIIVREKEGVHVDLSGQTAWCMYVGDHPAAGNVQIEGKPESSVVFPKFVTEFCGSLGRSRRCSSSEYVPIFVVVAPGERPRSLADFCNELRKRDTSSATELIPASLVDRG